MTPQLQETLSALATKLGTTVERLWPILVARERLSAILGIVFGFGFGFAAVYLLYYSVKKFDDLDNDFPAGLVVTIAVVALVVFFTMGFCNITDAVYPEVAAIKSLIPRK